MKWKENKKMAIVWWTIPITEALTAIISIFILKRTYKDKISTINEDSAIKNKN